MRIALLILTLTGGLYACQCQTSFRPCNEVGASDLVFTGRVESITPIFLNRWNRTSEASVKELNELYLAAQDHPSPESLELLKNGYRKAFPDLTPDVLHELEAAKDLASATSVFYTTLNRGTRVHFRIDTLYKQEKDDDAAAAPGDDQDDDDEIDVRTPFNDCGIDFQAGETYLVYANNDEGSGYYTATRCSRTRRLTDASEDLGYLFFYKERPGASSRVEGFVTADAGYQLSLSRMRDPESVEAPVAGAVVALESPNLSRFVETGASGRFVFDGLAEGDYRLTAWAAGYPAQPRRLGEPKEFHLARQGCGLEFLLIPKR